MLKMLAQKAKSQHHRIGRMLDEARSSNYFCAIIQMAILAPLLFICIHLITYLIGQPAEKQIGDTNTDKKGNIGYENNNASSAISLGGENNNVSFTISFCFELLSLALSLFVSGHVIMAMVAEKPSESHEELSREGREEDSAVSHEEVDGLTSTPLTMV